MLRLRRTIVGTVLLCLLGFALLADETPLPDDAEGLFRTGRKAMQEQKWERAISAFERFVSQHAENERRTEAYFLLSRSHAESGDKEEARKALIRFVSRHPDDDRASEALYAVGRSFRSNGDKEGALGTYRSLLKNYPGSTHARYAANEIWRLLDKRFNLWVNRSFGVEQDQPAVRVNGRNIGEATFRLFAIDAEAIRDAFVEDPKTSIQTHIFNPPSGAIEKVKEWTESLGSGWKNETVKLPIKEEGIYIVEALVADIPTRIPVLVSPHVLVTKAANGQFLVFATDRTSGAPVEGMDLYVRTREKKLLQGRTNGQGLYRAEGLAGGFVFGWREGSLAMSRVWGRGQSTRTIGYVTTDRPVYRPGHEVNYKVLLRKKQGGELLGAEAGTSVQVHIRNSRGKTVYEAEARTNEFGSIAGSFRLADEAPTGRYWVSTNRGGYGHFFVEAYRKPEYKVDVETTGGPFRLGDNVSGTIRATYYFGAPVTDAKVEWEIYRRPYWRPWWYNYGDGFYSWYYEGRSRHYGGRGQQVHRGTGRTDEKGAFDFTFSTEEEGDRDYVYTVVAKVVDRSRRQVTGQSRVVVPRTAFTLSLSPDKWVYRPGEAINLKVRSMDFENQPVGDVEISVAASHVDRKKDDEKETPVDETSVTTDAEGRANARIEADEPGYIRVVATAKDGSGKTVRAERHIYVADAEYAWGNTRFGGLKIVPDKEQYAPGDVAKILVAAPHEKATVLTTLEGDRFSNVTVSRLAGRATLLEVPIRQEHSPNVFFVASMVRDGQFHRVQKPIVVPPAEAFLDVEIACSKEKARPRDEVTYTVTARDHKGNPVDAEISLGIVDESIYAIRSEVAPDIRKAFYGKRWNRVQTTTSLQMYLWGQAGGGELSDSAESEELAAEAPSAERSRKKESKARGDKDGGKPLAKTEVRKYFPDTWYHEAQGRTGDDGKLTLTLQVPDSLTTWRTTVRAVTKESEVGQTTQKLTVSKPIIVRLTTPRFFTQRDTSVVTGVVHNYLDVEKEVKIESNFEGIEVTGEPFVSSASHGDPGEGVALREDEEGGTWATLPPKGEVRIDWPVKARIPGRAVITLKALTDEVSDAMQLPLPILPYGSPQYEARTGVLDDEEETSVTLTVPESSIREASRLRLSVSGSVAGTVIESLEYLVGYPYGCVEQTMSRFLPNVIVLSTLQELELGKPDYADELPLMIEKGLARLYNFQHGDGGWGWWEHDDTHPFMTAYVVYGLAQAQKADVAVRQGVLSRGVNTLRNLLQKETNLDARAYMLYALSHAGSVRKEPTLALFEKRSELGPYAKALLAHCLNAAGDREKALICLRNLEDEATTSDMHCFWKGETGRTRWTRNPLEATAYALKTWVELEPENENLHKVVRWLVANRRGGRWGISTKDTAAIIYAVCDYMSVSGELDPDMTVTMLLNGDPVLEGHITRDNLVAFEGSRDFSWDQFAYGKNEITFRKKGRGTLYYTASLRHFSQVDTFEPTEAGVRIRRKVERITYDDKGKQVLKPLGDATLRPGDEVRVTLTLDPTGRQEYMMIEDPIPAGCEFVKDKREYNPWWWGYWYSRKEYRDDKLAVASTALSGNTRTITYRLRAETPGTFNVLPARIFNMYEPEVGGTSSSTRIRIEE